MRHQAKWFVAMLVACEFAVASAACAEEEKKVSKTPSDAAIVAIDKFIAEQKIDKQGERWKERLPQPPKVEFDAKKKYFWDMETNVGKIVIRLMPEVAPMHVSSTIYLTRLGFYDTAPFHRVIPGFMAQGGDPTGSGRGGPGYKYAGEFDPKAKHSKPGILSMANAGPGTDGSQFFLTFKDTSFLDGKHTVFGEVVEGMETLRKLEEKGSPSGQTSSPLSIKTATIRVE